MIRILLAPLARLWRGIPAGVDRRLAALDTRAASALGGEEE